MTTRRIRANHTWIEDTITAGQRCGLTVSAVSHYPDGRCEVTFEGGAERGKAAKPKGWNI